MSSSQPSSQTEFISKIAHDLKTPLTVISAYAQLLTKKIENGEEVDADLPRKIHQAATKMAEQISQLAKTPPKL
jgi:signal transduction histidine kinase